MEYLTVGTDEITQELFIPIENRSDNLSKPRGGIWLTEYNSQYKNYNMWVDFLIDNPNILYYKSKNGNLWHQLCSVVTLKETAKIFNLDSQEKFNYLMNNYPYNEFVFSYEDLTKIYDGIYVDIRKLITDKHDKNIRKLVHEYAVCSLLLFNLECIKEYYPGYIDITPFDLEYYMNEEISYSIVPSKTKKRIK